MAIININMIKSPSSKLVLCATANHLLAGIWYAEKLQGNQSFNNDENGHLAFAEFLQQHTATPLYLIADAVEGSDRQLEAGLGADGAGLELGHRLADIALRALDAGGAGGGLVVDRAHIGERALAIDDVHVRRHRRAVSARDLALRVEQHGGRRGVAAPGEVVRLLRGDMALLAGGGGGDGQPDDALGGGFALLVLHVVGVVVLAHIGAVVIRRLEHDDLALVLRCKEFI